MTRDQAIALLREIAPKHSAAYLRLPRTAEDAANWMPPTWAIEAVMKSATPESKPVEIEFGFFQAEQLLGQFGGDTDARMTVSVDTEGKMHAWATEQPQEGAVELVDQP